MTSLNDDDLKRLRILEESAYRFMSDPLEKAFFHVENILQDRMDLKTSVKALASALIEIKRALECLR